MLPPRLGYRSCSTSKIDRAERAHRRDTEARVVTRAFIEKQGCRCRLARSRRMAEANLGAVVSRPLGLSLLVCLLAILMISQVGDGLLLRAQLRQVSSVTNAMGLEDS